jgi:hypothetical protein
LDYKLLEYPVDPSWPTKLRSSRTEQCSSGRDFHEPFKISYKRRLGRRRLQRFVRLSHSASMENSMFNQIMREISRRDIPHSPKSCFGMGTVGLYLRTPSQAVEIYWCAEGYLIVLGAISNMLVRKSLPIPP